MTTFNHTETKYISLISYGGMNAIKSKFKDL